MALITVKAGKKGGKRGKVSHYRVEPANNGFTSFTHFERPEGGKGMGYVPEPEPEKNIHPTIQGAAEHMIKTFGGRAPKPPKGEAADAENEGAGE